MVTERVPRSATYADLEALPDNLVGQILEGGLVVSPRPAIPHASASSALGGSLTGPFRFGDGGPEGWVLLDEPELHLGRRPDVVVPDLAGWRRERMPEIPAAAAASLAPDWACEALSPPTERFDRVRKQRIYAREGVGYVWHLSPTAQTLEVFRLENGRWSLLGAFDGDERVRAEPFDALELDLALLWAR